MPARLGPNARAIVYGLLAERDGEVCQTCAKAPPELKHPLEIDHLDEDRKNWTPANLHLLCKSCNVAKGNARRHPSNPGDTLRDPGDTLQAPGDTVPQAKPSDNPTDYFRGRERENPATRVVKHAAAYHTGPAEMKANLIFEPTYRSGVVRTVAERGHITKNDAIYAGSEFVGCNPKTAAHYLGKLVSFIGPLEEISDMLQERVIVLRNAAGQDDQEQEPDTHDEGQSEPETPAAQRPTSPFRHRSTSRPSVAPPRGRRYRGQNFFP